MTACISERTFQLFIDPLDCQHTYIGDEDGITAATVNRAAYGYDEGLAIARVLRAAPALLRALEIAADAYSPKSHLLGFDCTTRQMRAAKEIRAALSLALHGEYEKADA
jgi:hypothetical protein